MNKFGTLSDAIALAEFAHRNQLDKAGMPYIEHPLRVMAAIQGQGLQPFVQIAAVLHDVTEDTSFTPEILLKLGFSESAVELVRLLDRGESEAKYAVDPSTEVPNATDYYYERIRENPFAYKVKEADIADNLQDWRLVYLTPETQKRLRKKYAHAKRVLQFGWENAAHREQFIYE